MNTHYHRKSLPVDYAYSYLEHRLYWSHQLACALPFSLISWFMIKCFLQAKKCHVQRLVCCVILLYLAYIENCINNAMTRHKAALHLVDLNSLFGTSPPYAKIPSSFAQTTSTSCRCLCSEHPVCLCTD